MTINLIQSGRSKAACITNVKANKEEDELIFVMLQTALNQCREALCWCS